jgi:hypothetical protein
MKLSSKEQERSCKLLKGHQRLRFLGSLSVYILKTRSVSRSASATASLVFTASYRVKHKFSGVNEPNKACLANMKGQDTATMLRQVQF